MGIPARIPPPPARSRGSFLQTEWNPPKAATLLWCARRVPIPPSDPGAFSGGARLPHGRVTSAAVPLRRPIVLHFVNRGTAWATRRLPSERARPLPPPTMPRAYRVTPYRACARPPRHPPSRRPIAYPPFCTEPDADLGRCCDVRRPRPPPLLSCRCTLGARPGASPAPRARRPHTHLAEGHAAHFAYGCAPSALR